MKKLWLLLQRKNIYIRFSCCLPQRKTPLKRLPIHSNRGYLVFIPFPVIVFTSGLYSECMLCAFIPDQCSCQPLLVLTVPRSTSYACPYRHHHLSSPARDDILGVGSWHSWVGGFRDFLFFFNLLIWFVVVCCFGMILCCNVYLSCFNQFLNQVGFAHSISYSVPIRCDRSLSYFNFTLFDSCLYVCLSCFGSYSAILLPSFLLSTALSAVPISSLVLPPSPPDQVSLCSIIPQYTLY